MLNIKVAAYILFYDTFEFPYNGAHLRGQDKSLNIDLRFETPKSSLKSIKMNTVVISKRKNNYRKINNVHQARG